MKDHKQLDRDSIVALYQEGFSTYELAERLGMSARHIGRIVRKRVPMRSVSEAKLNAIARGRMIYAKPTVRRAVVRKYISPKLRAEIMIRDGHKCTLCGATASTDRLEIDHINNDPTDDRRINLRVLCQSCNLGKELLYRQELAERGIDRPKPRGKLPLPTIIVFCRKCHDVTIVREDRHGQFCADCQYPINWGE